MLSHRNLASNSATLHRMWGFVPGDVLLHALPIFHTHGLFVATNTSIANGTPMVFLERFDVDTVLEALPRCTVMMGVPTFYTRLLADPRFDASVCRTMRLFVSGSAPLLASVHRAFTDAHRPSHPRALRHDRDLDDHDQPARRRAATRHRGDGVDRCRRPGGRRRRRVAAGRRHRRHRGARPERARRVLASTRAGGDRVHRRRVVPHRRRRHVRRRRLPAHRRPVEGPDHQRRPERVPEGGRGRGRPVRRRARVGGGRGARRRLRRGGRGGARRRARGGGRARASARARPRPPRLVQGAQARARGRRAAAQRDGQGREVSAASDVRSRHRGRRRERRAVAAVGGRAGEPAVDRAGVGA